MNAHKLASLAGMTTMAAAAMVNVSIPAVFAQAGQPAAGSGASGGGQATGTPRANQPTRSNQPNRANQPNRTNQPGAADQGGTPVNNPGTGSAQDPNSAGSQGLPNQTGTTAVQPGTANGSGVVSTPRQRLFALDNSSLNGALADTSQRLANFETQLTDMNQKLLTQLGQARQLSGQRREDALAEVMQQMLIQQRTLLQFVSELRVSLTGDPTQDNGFDANGNPIGDGGVTGNGNGNGTVNNPNGTNNPNANPNNPNANPNNPNNPANPGRINPGRPTTNPNRQPAQPTNPTPQNPGTPTTNPSRNGG